jgi:surface carbohydrate biosynthesis protein
MFKNLNYKYLIYDNIDEKIFQKLINLKVTKIIDFRTYKKTKIILELIKLFYFFLINRELLIIIKLIKIILSDGFFIAFICAQIFRYKPKIVLTTTDNDLRFYKLKKYFKKSIKFLAVQNGLRSKFHDMFDHKEINDKKLSTDYYFSFGTNISTYIKKYIDVKVIPIGSFKSNQVKKKQLFKEPYSNPKILFISSFRYRKKNAIFETWSNGKKIYWKDILDNQIKLANLVNKFCINTNNKLFILGTDLNKNQEEEFFYKKNLPNRNWKFLKKKTTFMNYKIIDNFDIIVTCESTMGYEAFGRDKKVAFFAQKITPYNDWRFGWPANYPKKGLFYSNEISLNEVNRILDNLIKIKNLDWRLISIREKNKNMQYDYDNTKLKKYL